MTRRWSNSDNRAALVPIGHDVVLSPGCAPAFGRFGAGRPGERIGGDRRRRIMLMLALFGVCFASVSGRLLGLAWMSDREGLGGAGVQVSDTMQRPDIVDRNGRILATDIMSASLFADARKVQNSEETAAQIAGLFPDIDEAVTRERLDSGRAFVWLKRDLTPKQQYAVHNLGIPGLGFRRDHKRVYPNGRMASHILGLVNLDNHGTAGIERYIDTHGLSEMQMGDRPVALSIDLGMQYALTDELTRAMDEFSAKAAIGVVLDVRSGEVMAMSSLPDFDPNDPLKPSDARLFNQASLGVYEMGSTFKAFTVAGALDSGRATLAKQYDARHPIKVARFTINDYHAKRRWLTVSEIFMYSSNIGSAKMALDIGKEAHRGFLKRVGLLDRLDIELPESGTPLVPSPWGELSSMTISYGHGLSVTPLQMAAAGAILVNGGYAVKPTFIAREGEVPLGERVISDDTSRAMRALMRLVVERGTGRRADVDGYPVIGKTGTAEKSKDGSYARRSLLTSFLSAFPANDPRFVMLVLLDEPQGTKETYGFATAGWNAAPVTARVIRRIAPMLGVQPIQKWEIPVREAKLISVE